MAENYRGFDLNQRNDLNWANRENTFHKQIIDLLLDKAGSIPLDDGKIISSYIDHTIVDELSSGIVVGGIISINADNTKFNISSGHGHIVDYWSDPLHPIAYEVEWDSFNGISPTLLSTTDSTYVLIDRNGDLVQLSSLPTPQNRREYIWLGKVVHRNRTSISTVSTQPDHSLGSLSQLRDVMFAIKYINVDGNTIYPSGSELTIAKTAGVLFGNGINYVNDIKNPHLKSFSSLNPLSFKYLTQLLGYESSSTQSINPASYDLNGTITPVPHNKWTVQRVYLFPSGNVFIQYGQYVYNSLADSVSAIDTEKFTRNPDIKENAILLSLICIKQTCTNLSDVSSAKFIDASKFGEVVSGSGVGSTVTLQSAYDNAQEPEIVTNVDRGALTLMDGTGVSSASVIEIKNSSDVETARITEDGNFVGNVSLSKKYNVVDISTNQLGAVGQLLLVDATNPITITLPNSISTTYGKEIIIKKVSGGSTITITPHDAQLIDGSSNKTITSLWDVVTLVSVSNGWVII